MAVACQLTLDAKDSTREAFYQKVIMNALQNALAERDYECASGSHTAWFKPMPAAVSSKELLQLSTVGLSQKSETVFGSSGQCFFSLYLKT